MKKLVIIAITIISLTSCEDLIDSFKAKDRHYYIPANCKTILKKGDILVYESNYHNVAKYIVLDIVSGQFWVSRSKKDGIDNPPFDYNEFQASLLDSLGKRRPEDVNNRSGFSVPTLAFSQYTNFKTSIVISYYAPSIGIEITWNYNKYYSVSNSSSLKILNHQFENVSYSDIDTNLYTLADRHISTIYFNSQKGLLGFKCSNGEVFELVE